MINDYYQSVLYLPIKLNLTMLYFSFIIVVVSLSRQLENVYEQHIVTMINTLNVNGK